MLRNEISENVRIRQHFPLQFENACPREHRRSRVAESQKLSSGAHDKGCHTWNEGEGAIPIFATSVNTLGMWCSPYCLSKAKTNCIHGGFVSHQSPGYYLDTFGRRKKQKKTILQMSTGLFAARISPLRQIRATDATRLSNQTPEKRVSRSLKPLLTEIEL